MELARRRNMIRVYVCEKCGAKVIQQVLGDEPGRHEVSWCCINVDCSQCYGVPWREKDWEYPLAASLNVGLEPWPGESETNSGHVPLDSIAAVAARRPTMDDVRQFVSIVFGGITAGIVSAVSMLGILWLLLVSR